MYILASPPPLLLIKATKVIFLSLLLRLTSLRGEPITLWTPPCSDSSAILAFAFVLLYKIYPTFYICKYDMTTFQFVVI